MKPVNSAVVTLFSIGMTIPVVALAQDGNRVSGNETYVIVAPIANEEKALVIAEQHCAKYNRLAHFRKMEGFRAVFDCDPRKK